MSKKKLTFGRVLREGHTGPRLKGEESEVTRHDLWQMITQVTQKIWHSLRNRP
jgi:hypothetical protein